ncbi:putative damage-inducible protein DinB [Chitinophaga skermanii]|uniref:Putative damage-inducible protein DinB n=1 Tax=Chitinophaga skermanii TaxID=331697 RepID=A0A327QU76_9BACT|nr:DinB family protein [Chitinophaga skermanii]RAJ08216.1 putative damage-inducible protein DinB [Chitinophaga skermanii]
MKALKIFQILLVCLCMSAISFGQSTDEALKEWERAKAYTKEYLDVMPAGSYGLKPTPEMRSFAEQMLHLADANYGFTATITGEKAPYGFGALEKSQDQSKEAVTKMVMDSYDYVMAALKKMTPAELDGNIKFMNRFEMTRRVAFEKDFEHQTHHRGQTTVYIRLAGAKPPQEKLF